jgi:isopentenyl-diphosphate delta-isomerase
MRKVTPISKRKANHISINLEKNVLSGIRTGLERYSFTHEALPEIDLNDVNTSLNLFKRDLAAPILISSMTGGTAAAEHINNNLAEAAQECKIAMGIGSQRSALEKASSFKTFNIRRLAPDILLFANLGAIQLNNGFNLDDCQRAIDMLCADGLILHLNPLQEALQPGGNTNFKGLAKKIEQVCRNISVPIVVKEVGWGISEKTAKLLQNCGVSAIDVAGAGGTSWSQVEMHAATRDRTRQVAGGFRAWGIPTADSIKFISSVAPTIRIFASGGLTNGIDMAKCLALGASLAGAAGIFLKAANDGSEKVVEVIRSLHDQIRITMFVTGSVEVRDLAGKLIQND